MTKIWKVKLLILIFVFRNQKIYKTMAKVDKKAKLPRYSFKNGYNLLRRADQPLVMAELEESLGVKWFTIYRKMRGEGKIDMGEYRVITDILMKYGVEEECIWEQC